MTRQEVYTVIDSERDFQEHAITDPRRPDMIEDLHVGDTISAIEYNLHWARIAWYKGAVPHTEAMEFLRKIAALCVQAGETYGMPVREISIPPGTQNPLTREDWNDIANGRD
jgi:hypothetical protein